MSVIVLLQRAQGSLTVNKLQPSAAAVFSNNRGLCVPTTDCNWEVSGDSALIPHAVRTQELRDVPENLQL